MKLSVTRLQKELFKHFRERSALWFSANTLALGHEADFVAITSKRIVYEVEIKRSKPDFHADFKNKQLKHSILKMGKYPVNYFYFACEDDLIQPEEVPSPYGLIHIEKTQWRDAKTKRLKTNYTTRVVKNAKALHKEPLSDLLLIRLLTSIMYKYFNNLKTKD